MVTASNAATNGRISVKWMLVLAALCFISGYVLRGFTDVEISLMADGNSRSDDKTLISRVALNKHNSATRPPPRNGGRKNHSASWCPRTAVCHNSDLCHPCKHRFLIIFATGRSASTTLTWMMDSLPGVRMSGENNAILNQFQHMVDGLTTRYNYIRGIDQRTPWGHNKVPKGAFSCAVQHMIETINPPATMVNGSLIVEEEEEHDDTIVGFKTIRFLEDVNASGDEKKLVNFVKRIFPCARFVVNIRSDSQQQQKSLRATFGPGSAAKMDLMDLNRRMRNLVELFGQADDDYARLLDSSQWTQNVTVLNQVVEWLGFSEACFFKTLLEFNTGGFHNGRTNLTLPPDCRYLG